MGKNKPIWNPSTDCGDYVVAVGCHDLHTTGKKRLQKKYYSHTTRPGSLKEITMDKLMAQWGGSEILRRAVRGMLPKNKLRDERLSRLKSTILHLSSCSCHAVMLTKATAFEGHDHPYKPNILKVQHDSQMRRIPPTALNPTAPPTTTVS